MKRSIPCGLALAGALLVLSGCGSSNSSTASPAPQPSDTSSTPASGSSSGGSKSSAPAAAAVITIKDFAYSGASSVAPGTTVTIKNNDPEAHTVTADDSSGGFDVKVDPGASVTFKAPSKAGTYAYHCTYHSNMHGSLKVG